jgi:hypothetical protein
MREAGQYLSERFTTVTKCAVLEHAIVLLMRAAESGRRRTAPRRRNSSNACCTGAACSDGRVAQRIEPSAFEMMSSLSLYEEAPLVGTAQRIV